MALMRGVVLESFTLKPEQLFNVQPFQLDETLKTEPTLFEVTLVLDAVRYQYGFEFVPNRIVGEWLLVYQTAKPQQWFDRRFNPKTRKETFTFGSHLAGQKRSWQDATRENALFLSTAVQLNSEQLRPLHAWFANSLEVSLEGGTIPFHHSTNMVQTPEGMEAIRSIMSSADIAISEITAVRQKGVHHQLTVDLATGRPEVRREEGEVLVPHFRHQGLSTSANFRIDDESQGTQKLFALAGPLLDIIKHGKVLVIDELDRSLHPNLVRKIVSTFHDPELNTRGAQLIFSTHDTTLLDTDLMRRDQIWLTEKGPDQSSELIPLSDFSPRKGEALEKGYLSGRYGGVPILSEHLIPEDASGGK
jgi:predicted ATPase